MLVLGIVMFALIFYLAHCVHMAADVYSNPSIVINTRDGLGNKLVIDDFREAYTWLRSNTELDTKVGSWWGTTARAIPSSHGLPPRFCFRSPWHQRHMRGRASLSDMTICLRTHVDESTYACTDYGYQTTSMADRTVLVDNNTWNNTHIATVGKAMGSDEETAWHIFRNLDTDYVLVVFGGLIGYSADDLNKLIWMVRIASGEYPEIQEDSYMSRGQFLLNASGSKVLLNCLAYKLSYYNFHKATKTARGGPGYDSVRRYNIGRHVESLQYFEEAFTSKNWLMRIYRVLDQPAY